MGAGQSEKEASRHQGQLLPGDAGSDEEGDSTVVVPGLGREQTPLTPGKEGPVSVSICVALR